MLEWFTWCYFIFYLFIFVFIFSEVKINYDSWVNIRLFVFLISIK
jgi:hypothetical protein